MAIMTPSTPPADERGKKAERAAYEAFRSQLPDDFYVYHSLELLADGGQEAEIDFLVLHPALGMLVVECKGGGVERNSAGEWIRKDGARVDRLDKSPWEQAGRQMHTLRSRLEERMRRPSSPLKALVREHGGFPLTYGRAVMFPFADIDSEGNHQNLPLDARRETLFVAADLDDLEERIRVCFAFWRGERDKATFDDEQFRYFREDILYPPTSLGESLSAHIRSEDRQFERLTDEQLEVVHHIRDQQRMVVEGGAGSGKSLLAVEAARILADGGKRVLLSCFNRKLRGALQRSIDRGGDADGSVTVNHFHGLCHRAFQAVDQPVDVPESKDPEVRRAFWEDEAPWILLEALEAGQLDTWDAIVVDEGQDFHDEWWEILESALRDESDRQMIVFQDPSQNLFRRDAKGAPIDNMYPLSWNFRNTTEIAKVVSQLYSGSRMKSHPRTPSGEPPEVQRYNSREGQRRAIDRLVRQLVNGEGIHPHQLAVLTPRTKKNSVLAGCDTLGEIPVTDELDENRQGDAILHSSIGSFKGLERDIIIFADVDSDHERCSVNARYVAASRAVNRLFVFEASDWLADV